MFYHLWVKYGVWITKTVQSTVKNTSKRTMTEGMDNSHKSTQTNTMPSQLLQGFLPVTLLNDEVITASFL